MGIGVYIELGGINTLTSPDSIVDLYATFNQAESQNKSDNIKFGLRQRMKSGKTMLNHSQFLGYTKGPDGVLRVVPEEAEIVRKIFDLYVQGNGVRKIKRYLEEHGIKTVTGKREWSTSTIDRMLSNVWGDRIFEKCGIRRDEGGDGGKTIEIRGKRRLSARDRGANYQQS